MPHAWQPIAAAVVVEVLRQLTPGRQAAAPICPALGLAEVREAVALELPACPAPTWAAQEAAVCECTCPVCPAHPTCAVQEAPDLTVTVTAGAFSSLLGGVTLAALRRLVSCCGSVRHGGADEGRTIRLPERRSPLRLDGPERRGGGVLQ